MCCCVRREVELLRAVVCGCMFSGVKELFAVSCV